MEDPVLVHLNKAKGKLTEILPVLITGYVEEMLKKQDLISWRRPRLLKKYVTETDSVYRTLFEIAGQEGSLSTENSQNDSLGNSGLELHRVVTENNNLGPNQTDTALAAHAMPDEPLFSEDFSLLFSGETNFGSLNEVAPHEQQTNTNAASLTKEQQLELIDVATGSNIIIDDPLQNTHYIDALVQAIINFPSYALEKAADAIQAGIKLFVIGRANETFSKVEWRTDEVFQRLVLCGYNGTHRAREERTVEVTEKQLSVRLQQASNKGFNGEKSTGWRTDVSRDFHFMSTGIESPDIETKVHQFEQTMAMKAESLDKYIAVLTTKISEFLTKLPEEKAQMRRQQIQHILSNAAASAPSHAPQQQPMTQMPVSIPQTGGMTMQQGRVAPPGVRNPNAQPAQPVPVQPVTVQPVTPPLGMRMAGPMNQVPPASMKSPQPQPVPVPRLMPNPNMSNNSPMSTLQHPTGPIHVAPAPSDDLQIIENPGGPRPGQGMAPAGAPKGFLPTRGPGQPIDIKKDIQAAPGPMTGSPTMPPGPSPITNPGVTPPPNPNAAVMAGTREEIEAKVNAKLTQLSTYKTWLMLLLKRMEKTTNKKAEDFKKRVVQVNATVNTQVTAAMTKENLANILTQLSEAELQLKSATFENLFNNVRYQTSNVQRAFEQFFDTLKTEAPDVTLAKQVKTYFKLANRGSLDFMAIAKQVSDKPEELFWWEHTWSKKREHAAISMKTERDLLHAMDATPVDEPPFKRRKLASTIFDNAKDHVKKVVSEDLYWKAARIIDENVVILEEFGSNRQLIVNCQPQNEGASTYFDLAFKDASVMFPTFEIVPNRFNLTFDTLVREKVTKSKKANQQLINIIKDILSFCKVFMVKISVLLEDLAQFENIEIEEEMINNVIYLKLTSRMHPAPLYLHFSNITKYPQSTPTFHFVQQDGMDMDKLQNFSQNFTRTMPKKQLIVQDGQKINQLSTIEIVSHWLQTPFE